jgi:3-deoxy-D-manno-octulosonic-acid transferase
VPRHPDRGRDLARQLDARLRTEGDPLPTDGIWIADTMGEMGLWYRLVPIAFVGRSLVPPGGGQNPLEPARLGCVIAVGPYTGNFTDHIALLREAGSLVETADPAGLAHFVRAMLNDPVRRGRMGQLASAVVLRHQDLPARTAQALLALLPVA